MANNYDPFTHRKALPPFPSLFGGKVGQPGGVKPTQKGWEMPFQHVTGAPGATPALPDFPAEADDQNAWGGTPVPEFPAVTNGWQQLVPGAATSAQQPAEIDDATHARGIMEELNAIQQSIDGSDEDSGAHTEGPIGPAMSDEPHTTGPIGAAAPDRSWMFEENDGWDAAQTQSRNYTPAPVTFEGTKSSNWGTALDKRPQRTGPADSTVRYYQRAMDRAKAYTGKGVSADQRRIGRLSQRINGRPTNG